MSGGFTGVNHVQQGATTVREIETIVRATENALPDFNELIEAIKHIQIVVNLPEFPDPADIHVAAPVIELKPLIHVDLPTQPPVPAPTVQVIVPQSKLTMPAFFVFSIFVAIDILLKLWALHGSSR